MDEMKEQQKQDIQYEGEKMKAAMQESLSGNTESAKEHVRSAAEYAKDRGKDYLDQGKEIIADEMYHMSSALHQASQKLAEQNDFATGWVDNIANQVDNAAHYLSDSNPDRIIHDTTDFVRRHPALTAGALFAAGVAVSRFVKAGFDREEERRERISPESP